MKCFLLLLICAIPLSAEAYRRPKKFLPPPPQEEVDTEELEQLAMRRISKLWKDCDFQLAQTEIYAFFDRFPASGYRDSLQIILGNIALAQKEYAVALAAYDAVRERKKREEVRKKRWQALYNLQSFSALYHELSPLLPFLTRAEKEEGSFFFAESAFREALTLSHYAEREEEARALAREALPHYEALLESKRFGKHVKLAIAEIHRLLGHCEKAATLYLEIARNEKENEELLFHAAVMLAKFDETSAIATFRKVSYLNGVRSQEATYQWMQLLAKQGKWSPLFTESALFLSKLPSHRLPLFHFYRGMVLHSDRKWGEAVNALTKSLELGLLYPYDKNALFAVAMCAYELCDVPLMEQIFPTIAERYEMECGEVALLRAFTFSKAGKKEEALTLFDNVLEAGYSAALFKRALKEKIHLLLSLELWDEAYGETSRFLTCYPQGEKEMLKLACDLSLHLLGKEEGYALLTANLKRAFEEKAFAKGEVAHYTLLLAKGLTKQERFQEALQTLESIEEESGEQQALIALCSLKEGYRPEHIILHGERALALDPNLPEKERLRLYLFNAYLDAAKEHNDPELNRQAEEHLYSIIHVLPISLENRLWLAHRFAKNEAQKERAIEIFESLIDHPAQIVRFAREAFILANLYTERGKLDRAGELLEGLRALQEDSPFAEEVRLALAHHYVARHELQRAFSLYSELEHAQEAHVALRARLEHSRLHYTLFPEELKVILPVLKDLWMKKRIATEPIHLEAALDYLTFLQEELDSQALLEEFSAIREHFTLEDDIWSKDYHTSRYQMPEQDLLYQAHLRYIDGRIAQLEAIAAQGEGDLEKVERLKKRAHALFTTLANGKYPLSKYLVEKVQQEMYDRP